MDQDQAPASSILYSKLHLSPVLLKWNASALERWVKMHRAQFSGRPMPQPYKITLSGCAQHSEGVCSFTKIISLFFPSGGCSWDQRERLKSSLWKGGGKGRSLRWVQKEKTFIRRLLIFYFFLKRDAIILLPLNPTLSWWTVVGRRKLFMEEQGQMKDLNISARLRVRNQELREEDLCCGITYESVGECCPQR